MDGRECLWNEHNQTNLKVCNSLRMCNLSSCCCWTVHAAFFLLKFCNLLFWFAWFFNFFFCCFVEKKTFFLLFNNWTLFGCCHSHGVWLVLSVNRFIVIDYHFYASRSIRFYGLSGESNIRRPPYVRTAACVGTRHGINWWQWKGFREKSSTEIIVWGKPTQMWRNFFAVSDK